MKNWSTRVELLPDLPLHELEAMIEAQRAHLASLDRGCASYFMGQLRLNGMRAKLDELRRQQSSSVSG